MKLNLIITKEIEIESASRYSFVVNDNMISACPFNGNGAVNPISTLMRIDSEIKSWVIPPSGYSNRDYSGFYAAGDIKTFMIMESLHKEKDYIRSLISHINILKEKTREHEEEKARWNNSLDKIIKMNFIQRFLFLFNKKSIKEVL